MLKHTVLNAVHRALGARMVDFGGWDMPVNYGSQIDEHHAVRTDAGHVRRVAHARRRPRRGAGARDFLRYALANNVDKLTRSRARRSTRACCADDGGVLDDLIVYFLREDLFRLVVNAGTADKDIAWLRALAASARRDGRAHAAPRPGDDRRAGAAGAREACGRRCRPPQARPRR